MDEQERAMLWAAYWGLRAIERPTPILRAARAHLWSMLEEPESRPPPRAAERLRRRVSEPRLRVLREET